MIFSPKFLICFDTVYQLKTYLETRDTVCNEFDVRFHTKGRKSNLLCTTEMYKTRIGGGRSYSSITDSVLDFCTKKTDQYLQT